MHHYIYISKKLARLGMEWELSKPLLQACFAHENCFSRLTVYG